MSEYTINALGRRIFTLDAAPEFDSYSGVEIIVSEETTYFAGDETGRILTIENPWGTQQQADNILTAIRGFQYRPYTADGAMLDPAAEIGDGVNLNGLYSGLYHIRKNYSSLMATDISAPADEEVDHEYKYESKADRKITRRFEAIESEFRVQSDEIAAKVSQTGGNNSSFGWQLMSDHFSLFSGNAEVFRVDDSGAVVKGHFEATSGKIGNFNIGTSSIWNNINNFANSGNLSSGVYLGTDGIRLGKNFTVNSAGSVTANNMTLTGTLNVGGSTITAAQLRQGAYSAYSNGSYWSGGAAGGFRFDDATKSGTSQYPTSFKCGTLQATGAVLAATLSVGGRGVGYRNVTINGANYALLGVTGWV